MKLDDIPHVPGYKPFRNAVRYPNHGGICMYVKSCFIEFVQDVKFFNDDVIYVTFKFMPDVTFCGCYSPPSDSHYYDLGTFANMSANILESSNRFVILGDLNAKIKDRHEIVASYENLSYTPSADSSNSNGDLLKSICCDCDLLVLNNLIVGEKVFTDALTFRRKDQWISQLDICFVSQELLDDVNTFDVIQDPKLPSDHAAISLNISVNQTYVTKRALQQSVQSLVDYTEVRNTKFMGQKPIPMMEIDSCGLCRNASLMSTPVPPNDLGDFQSFADELYSSLYELASRSRVINDRVWNTSLSRWTRLLNLNDSRTIWKAINWKGGLVDSSQIEPTVDEFKCHFEALLNPDIPGNIVSTECSDCPYIPILDDPVTFEEAQECMNQCKPNKACDINGISPGIFRYLPAQWILTIVFFMNIVFNTVFSPASWIYSKLIVIFKKGERRLCGNYRGISINDTIYRIFDKILYSRLTLWYKPSNEQAGCQEKRGCTEQILTLRLLCDYAKKKRVKLYLLYIDFEKAYDKVARRTLLDILKKLGCGGRFLAVLAKIYSDIKLVFKSAVISTSIGVRQGSASSCMLFIIYLDVMVKLINSIEIDGFLLSHHCLLLMDDTVLLATTREKLIQKFKIVQSFCRDYGMSINVKKTKFMVINRQTGDQEPIISEGITVKYCTSYLYLGAYITDDGSYRSSIDLHVKDKKKHLLKYVSFLQKNCDFPFLIKKKVAEACLFSSILYGCETWCCLSYGKMESLYIGIIKSLLAVRQTICNDLCLVESNMPSLKAAIRQRQHKYFSKKLRSLEEDSTLQFAYNLVKSINTASYKVITDVLADSDIINKDKRKLSEDIRCSIESSKRATYLSINPLLCHPKVYQNNTIDEYKRIEYTRSRLSSHYLKIETGRWSRIPRELRFCNCGKDIQTEEHVLLHCEHTEIIRSKYNITESAIGKLFERDDNVIVNFVYEVMKKTKP